MAETQRRNITLGTAGHIDHGKTALIKLLTGCETDRLKIEKQRGMSIELGFAPCLVSGMEFGIVDVPGHENFIKTMVAGAGGVDGAILVVAADDGVMPQTREHLDILTLLGVEHGIIALTKVDCVKPDRIVTVTQQVRNFLIGTFLEKAPILPLSSITGEGFDGFYEALKQLVASIEPKPADGVFRVPVERAFSAKGYGTIAAGIPVSGTVAVGDEVVILPQREEGRIRAIQVYNRPSEIATVGQCAALNVPQWDPKDITRGQVITVGDYFAPSSWYLCDVQMLPLEKTELKNGATVKFHTGTSETVARIYLFQDEVLSAGGRCPAQIRLNEPLVAGPADHFIIRTLSPTRTIGGGVVIEAIERRLKRSRPEVAQDVRARAKAISSVDAFVEYCVLSTESLTCDEKALALRAKLPVARAAKVLSDLELAGRIERLGAKLYIHRDTAAEIEHRLSRLVEDFHREHPESPGVTRDRLRERASLSKPLFDGLIAKMLASERLIERKNCLSLPTHHEQFSQAEIQLLQTVEGLFRESLFSPPGQQEIARAARAAPPQLERTFRILVEQHKLVRVDQDLYFHADAVARARELLTGYIREHGSLESVKFKYLLDTTRKYAIPLLDYFDKTGVTRRDGYTRYLR